MQEMLRQLVTVAELQRRLLPRVVPQPPSWRLATHYEAGLWPGGGYYDFLPLPDGRLLFLIADASDQGAPAAALVAILRAVIHSCPLSSGTDHLPFCPLRDPLAPLPHILLGHLNRVMADNALEEQFLTAFCGLVEPAGSNLRYANAGHPTPRCWRHATQDIEPVRDTTGLPLGVDRQASYHQRRLLVEPGDVLVLYSDGLTAALNARGQMFGSGRLDDAVAQAAPAGAQAVQSAVRARLREFLGGAEPQDDVTLLVLERLAE